MLCDICKIKEATIHLTQMVEGKTRKADLCDDCAKEKNVAGDPEFSVMDLLLGSGAMEGIKVGTTEGQCPVCGLSAADFKKTGRLGCGACWATFERGLTPLLKEIHRGTLHVGKVPMRLMKTREVTEQLHTLEQELKTAVKEERYEDAVELRNQIRLLEANKPSASI